MTSMIRILLVDDHPLMREGVRSCLKSYKDIQIVGEADNGDEAIRLTRELAPDVILMDLYLPERNGLEVIKRVLEIMPKTQILVLTAHANPEYIQGVMTAGARGYVLKGNSPRELVRAIQEIRHGATFFCSGTARSLLTAAKLRDGKITLDQPDRLSAREMQVMKLLAEGLTNKEIAHQLRLSVRTIETVRKRLMSKFKVKTVAALMVEAFAKGLVNSP